MSSRLSVDLTLEVGQVADSIEVTAEAPLLETRSASGGRLVSGREVAELPVSAMNPFLLAGLAAGMQWTGTPSACSEPLTLAAPPRSTRLEPCQNEYTLDWDLKLLRNFPITERARFVLAMDALNATNHTNFAAPDTDPTGTTFGQVRSAVGAPRVLQLNPRVEF